MASLLLDEVSVRRRGARLLDQVTLQIAGTGCTILLGPNGAGKTTLLRVLHGMERISSGQITWPSPDHAARQGFVFQTPVMMRRSVIDNVAYPLRLTGVGRAAARAKAVPWLDRVGLGAVAAQPARLLSGGERQKLALARALIRQPDLLLLDEPCASLDGRATREIEEILARQIAEGTRIVMSTHDLGQARRLADEVVFLHQGHVVEQTPATRFFDQPATPQAQAFLNGDILE